jgi:hypothetical protein
MGLKTHNPKIVLVQIIFQNMMFNILCIQARKIKSQKYERKKNTKYRACFVYLLPRYVNLTYRPK